MIRTCLMQASISVTSRFTYNISGDGHPNSCLNGKYCTNHTPHFYILFQLLWLHCLHYRRRPERLFKNWKHENNWMQSQCTWQLPLWGMDWLDANQSETEWKKPQSNYLRLSEDMLSNLVWVSTNPKKQNSWRFPVFPDDKVNKFQEDFQCNSMFCLLLTEHCMPIISGACHDEFQPMLITVPFKQVKAIHSSQY